MNEAASVMYKGPEFGAPEKGITGGKPEHSARYPLDLLPLSGGSSAPEQRPPSVPRPPGDSAFGYESDDSSLSSNASSSNKSSEKGDFVSRSSSSQGSRQSREWRWRRRDQRPRRIAPDRFLHASYPFQVKYAPEDLLNGSQWDSLSQEIWDKFMKAQQTEETFRKKMDLWRYLYITIKAIFPRYGLYVVGSTMSGFGLEGSDLDLCLHVRGGPQLEPRQHALLHLGFILHYIRALDPSAELIQAKVPILKFYDSRTGLHVDLNCNNVVGIRNTNLLYCYCRLDWRVRPLVVAVKLWALAHDINDARRATLSSYALTLMVLHFLQCGVSPPVLGGRGGSANRQPLGELFVLFLRYYAHFPFDKWAVSVRAGGPLPIAECRAVRAAKNDPHQWKLLCVEEPFDLTNTARSVYDPALFARIVAAFRGSYGRVARGGRLQGAWPLS